MSERRAAAFEAGGKIDDRRPAQPTLRAVTVRSTGVHRGSVTAANGLSALDSTELEGDGALPMIVGWKDGREIGV
jgi:hypothetical protein